MKKLPRGRFRRSEFLKRLTPITMVSFQKRSFKPTLKKDRCDSKDAAREMMPRVVSSDVAMRNVVPKRCVAPARATAIVDRCDSKDAAREMMPRVVSSDAAVYHNAVPKRCVAPAREMTPRVVSSDVAMRNVAPKRCVASARATAIVARCDSKDAAPADRHRIETFHRPLPLRKKLLNDAPT